MLRKITESQIRREVLCPKCGSGDLAPPGAGPPVGGHQMGSGGVRAVGPPRTAARTFCFDCGHLFTIEVAFEPGVGQDAGQVVLFAEAALAA